MNPSQRLLMMPIDKLTAYARNPRKNDAVVDKMKASIQEFGFRIPIVATSDGTVVDGHLRLKAAKELGLTEVPVIPADDLSEAQIKAFRSDSLPTNLPTGQNGMTISSNSNLKSLKIWIST